MIRAASLLALIGLCCSALPASAAIGVDEKLGQSVPLDLEFLDEDGKTVRLGDLVDKPTLLSFVYFRCPSICNILLAGVADVIEKVELEPGKDFKVISISFAEGEGPDLAKRKKANYFKRMGKPPGEANWRFLTGSPEAIKAITDATGFQYERTGKDYQHPAVMMALSPQGKISRYLYGVSFLPFDVKMAIYEAAQGRTGPTINKILLFCFSYDPEGKTYVFNVLKVTGVMTMLFAGMFVGVLVLAGRKSRKRDAKGDG